MVLAGCGSHSAMQSGTQTGTQSGTQTSTTPNLSAETANNTSAADSFAGQSDGNLGANNVSKLNVHSLLYPGSTTKVLAQMLLWFGQSDQRPSD